MKKLYPPYYLKKYLTPNVFFDLCRVGSINDGGYLIPKFLIEKINLVLVGGLGDNIDFELDLMKLNPNLTILAFDKSIDKKNLVLKTLYILIRELFHFKIFSAFINLIKNLNKIYHLHSSFNKRFHFFPLFINNDKSINNITFEKFFDNCKGNTLVKLDIEGSEYQIYDLNDSSLKKFQVLIVEFHDCSIKRFMFEKIMDKLLTNFNICHVSINNGEGSILDFPNCIEITFVSKTYKGEKLKTFKCSPFDKNDNLNDLNSEEIIVCFDK